MTTTLTATPSLARTRYDPLSKVPDFLGRSYYLEPTDIFFTYVNRIGDGESVARIYSPLREIEIIDEEESELGVLLLAACNASDGLSGEYTLVNTS